MRYLIPLFLLAQIVGTASVLAQEQESVVKQIADAKKLLDEGVIDEAEFKALKDKLLRPEQANAKPAEAQVLAKPDFACVYSGDPVPAQLYAINSFAEDATAEQAVKEIIEHAGLVPRFVIRPADVPNAMATIFGGDRYILYAPQFFHQLKTGSGTNWAAYSVLAHEIGHHLQGHTLALAGSQPPLELEADEFSGFILAKLGATLEQAQVAMKQVGSPQDTPTHPGRDKRLAAIERGWKRGKKDAVPPQIDIKPVPEDEPPPEPAVEQRRPCVHRIPCVHQIPCQHTIPCQHAVPCQHTIPCTHTYVTPYGLMQAHPYDVLHAFDLAHPADTQHAADVQHEFDVAHPEGDPE